MNDEYKFIMTKTLLKCYADLENWCVHIDYKSSRIGLGSRSNDIFVVADKLLKLRNEKIDYINIKVMLDEGLSNISKSEYLHCRYIEKEKLKNIAEKYQISTRNLSRYIYMGIEKLALFLFKKYNYEICDIFRSNKRIAKIYREEIKIHNNNQKGKLNVD